jgi:hypothetical protein
MMAPNFFTDSLIGCLNDGDLQHNSTVVWIWHWDLEAGLD